MENIHDWINSGIMAIICIAYFTQKSILNTMKIALESINIEKIRESQELLLKNKEEHYKLILDSKIRETIRGASKTFQDVNKDFIEKFNELINIPFSLLKDKDWQVREKYLSSIPLSAPMIRSLLEAYDRGEFEDHQKEGD